MSKRNDLFQQLVDEARSYVVLSSQEDCTAESKVRLLLSARIRTHEAEKIMTKMRPGFVRDGAQALLNEINSSIVNRFLEIDDED